MYDQHGIYIYIYIFITESYIYYTFIQYTSYAGYNQGIPQHSKGRDNITSNPFITRVVFHRPRKSPKEP